MRISRRVAAMVAAVLSGLVLLAGAGAAYASSSGPGTHHSVQVLQFRTVAVSSAVNDAGHGGPGNVVAILFDIRTTAGAEGGQAYISCTAVTSDVTLCHAAFALPGGQIEAQVANGMAASFTAAITGGTGIYEGVTGQIRNVVSAPGVIDRTFYLIQPDQH